MSRTKLTLIHAVPTGAVFRHGGTRYRLVRHHRGAPKGRVLIEVENVERGGVAMGTVPDTDRVAVET